MGTDVHYRPLVVEEAGEALTVQRAAYVISAQRYGSADIPPLTETLEDFQAAFQRSTFVGALLGTRVVGSLRLTVEGDIGEISRVSVAPDLQGRGIATGLLRTADELASPDVREFQLSTKTPSNMDLYERCGYEIYSERFAADGVRSVLMKKKRG